MAFGDEHDKYLSGVEAQAVKWYWGTVVQNDDPDILGRVKAHVPGITKHSTDWAWPVGMAGSGSARNGAYSVPKDRSTVLIGFVLGDFDEPVYMAGPWPMGKDAKPGVPRKVQQQTDPKKATKVRVLAETENFEVYICDQEGDEQRLVLAGLDGKETIAVNLIDGSIRLTASHYLVLDAPRVDIAGTAQLTLNGRPVSWSGPKI